MGKKRVILLTQYLGMGGLERVVLNLAKGLKLTDRYEPITFVYDSIPGAPTLNDDFAALGAEVVVAQKGRGVSLKIAARLAWTCVYRRAFVIHSHDLSALIYAVFAKWLTLGFVRVVHTQHSFVHINNGRFYKFYERFFTAFASRACTVSEALKQQYSTVGIDPARIQVVANGMDFPEQPLTELTALRETRTRLIRQVTDPAVCAKLHECLDWVWVLCMARVHPGKGQDHVLDLWNGMSAQSPVRGRALLIFLGQETSQGELAKLEGKMALAADRAHIVYAGFTKNPNDWRLASNLFVSGSEFEGMPLGPIEALGAGVDVFISDIPGHSMLPSDLPRFSLKDKAAGASRLESLLVPLLKAAGVPGAAQFRGLRAEGWKRGAGMRDRYGILGMTRAYEKLYQR